MDAMAVNAIGKETESIAPSMKQTKEKKETKALFIKVIISVLDSSYRCCCSNASGCYNTALHT